MKFVISELRQALQKPFVWCPLREMHVINVYGRKPPVIVRAAIPRWCENQALVKIQGEEFYLCWSPPVIAGYAKPKLNKQATEILSNSFVRMSKGRKPRTRIYGKALLYRKQKELYISLRLDWRQYQDVREWLEHYGLTVEYLSGSRGSFSVAFKVEDHEFHRFVQHDMTILKTALG